MTAFGPSYSDQLRDSRWQRKRLEIMARDNWQCVWCRDAGHGAGLQVHHRRYIKGRPPWEAPDSQLVTLCAACHDRATKLIDKAKDILADLNIYELPIAVTTMERIWSIGTDHPLKVALDRFEAEKVQLISAPFTPAASRKVEALDELTKKIWDYIRADFVEANA